MMRAALLLLAAVVTSCASVPRTHSYRLVPPATTAAPRPSGPVLAIEDIATDAAYDDERIAYRPNPYQLEYYNYHVWSAPPSLEVADYLRTAYADTGLFARVTRDAGPNAAVLRGRLSAFEEIDVTEERWVGLVDLELSLEHPETGEVIWSRRYREREPLNVRSPSGLAAALSRAMARIVASSAPVIAREARQASTAGE